MHLRSWCSRLRWWWWWWWWWIIEILRSGTGSHKDLIYCFFDPRPIHSKNFVTVYLQIFWVIQLTYKPNNQRTKNKPRQKHNSVLDAIYKWHNWKPNKTSCTVEKIHRRQDNAATSIWLLAHHRLACSRDRHKRQPWRRVPTDAICPPHSNHLQRCHTQYHTGFYSRLTINNRIAYKNKLSHCWLN